MYYSSYYHFSPIGVVCGGTQGDECLVSPFHLNFMCLCCALLDLEDSSAYHHFTFEIYVICSFSGELLNFTIY